MFLGIEIGGTKLQIGVGDGVSLTLSRLLRFEVDPTAGGAGIRSQIARHAAGLIAETGATHLGVAFGGPIHVQTGRTITSHQVAGWDDFPLTDWCRETLGVPTTLGNDCDCAALAEARLGAGRGCRVVFYVTVGTGVGGGLVIDNRLYGDHSRAVAEIGHLRPGLSARETSHTVESIASGRGLEEAARWKVRDLLFAASQSGIEQTLPAGMSSAEIGERSRLQSAARELLNACGGDLERLTGKRLAESAMCGNVLSREVIAAGIRGLGWAIAQAITLVAPEIVVVGGGVSLIGEELFFEPLRKEVATYVFAPLRDSYRIVPAALGEEVVVHGALALANDAHTLQKNADERSPTLRL